jgi:hypothetical protein
MRTAFSRLTEPWRGYANFETKDPEQCLRLQTVEAWRPILSLTLSIKRFIICASTGRRGKVQEML